MLLLGRREATIEGDSEVLHEEVREGWKLLLPLKLPGIGGEMVPRSFSAHTHAHTRNRGNMSNGGNISH